MKYLVRSLLFLVSISISADTFQNVNGFFGERAAGMGGAYSAISDDVSGTYYNPVELHLRKIRIIRSTQVAIIKSK